MNRNIAAGRLGGLTTSSRYTGEEMTRKAKDGFWRRFLNEADPTGILPEGERQRRAEALLKIHMGRLAIKSAKARGTR